MPRANRKSSSVNDTVKEEAVAPEVQVSVLLGGWLCRRGDSSVRRSPFAPEKIKSTTAKFIFGRPGFLPHLFAPTDKQLVPHATLCAILGLSLMGSPAALVVFALGIKSARARSLSP